MKLIDFDGTGYIERILGVPEIKGTPEAPPLVIPGDPRTFDRIEVTDDIDVSHDKHYVLNGVVEPRPTWNPIVSVTTIPADGQTPITVSGAPVAVKVNLLGPAADLWSEAAGDISVAVGLPGAYTLLIDAFPYQVVEVKFNAT